MFQGRDLHERMIGKMFVDVAYVSPLPVQRTC